VTHSGAFGNSPSGLLESSIGTSGWPGFPVAVKFGIKFLSGTMSYMNQATNPRPIGSRESEIEFLARKTGTPVDTVKEIYRIERDKLARSARIQTFVPLLAHQRVKTLLQVEPRRRRRTSLVAQGNNS
jgi:hypothetical protein